MPRRLSIVLAVWSMGVQDFFKGGTLDGFSMISML